MRRLILVLMSNMLLGRNFDFLRGYLVATARYLNVTTGQCSLLLVPTFSMNEAKQIILF